MSGPRTQPRGDVRMEVWTEPPAEMGSVLGASGGAAPLLQANSPTTAPNAGLPWRNRQGERVWFGRVERHPGAE